MSSRVRGCIFAFTTIAVVAAACKSAQPPAAAKNGAAKSASLAAQTSTPTADSARPSTLYDVAVNAGNGTGPKTAGQLPTSMRSILGVTIAKTKRHTVETRVGAATPWMTGDASEARGYLCYRVGNDSTIVTFVTDGESAAGANLYDGFVVQPLHSAAAIAPHCTTALTSTAPATPGGLRLGLTTNDVTALLGPPRTQTDTSAVYVWKTEEPIPTTAPNYATLKGRSRECYNNQHPFLDVRAAIAIKYVDRRVAAFAVWRSDVSFC